MAKPLSQTEEIEGEQIVYTEIVLMENNVQKRIKLIADTPPLTESYKLSNSVDIVIPHYLAECGWMVSPIDVATAPMVAMFLVRYLGPIVKNNGIWKRVVQRIIPKSIETNSYWTTTYGSKYSFTPNFWVDLFSNLECRINPDVMKSNSYMREMTGVFFCLTGVVPDSNKVLMFPFLKALSGVNLHDVLDNGAFRSLLFGKCHNIQGISTDVIANKISGMNIQYMDAYVDAVVMLLCATYFRKEPLLKYSAASGLVPVFQSAVAEAERRKIMEENAARKAAEKENEEAMVGEHCTCDVVVIELPHVPYGGETPKVDPAQKQVQQQAQKLSIPSTPKLPTYRPYPSVLKSATIEEISADSTNTLAACAEIPTVIASAEKSMILREISKHALFSNFMEMYCEAAKFNKLADFVCLFRSIAVCLFGGDGWVKIHEAMLPMFGTLTQPEEMRNVVGLIDLKLLRTMLDFCNIDGGVFMKPDAMKIQSQFISRVSPVIKIEDSQTIFMTWVKMILVAYYEQWEPARTVKNMEGIDTTELWRYIYTWSYDTRVKSMLDEWKAMYQVLPIPIRALVLKLFFAEAILF
jgi:hypothetical protein